MTRFEFCSVLTGAAIAGGLELSRVAAWADVSTTQSCASKSAVPEFTILDAQIKDGDRAGLARVRRNGPTHYSCALRFQIHGGDLGPQAAGAGEFVFEHDVDEVVLPVGTRSGLRGGQTIAIRIDAPRMYDAHPRLARAEAIVSAAPVTIPDLPAGSVSRLWNQPIRRRPPPTWPRDFFSNLVDGFVISGTGFDPHGKRCFRNSLSHGRAQFATGEVGLYSDPAEQGTAPLQLRGGKRLLVAERLPAPITLSQGGQTKVCTHSSPIVSTETNALLGYGRFEYRFALLDMQQGCWPAGWQLCLPPWRWPACEQDTVEISFSRPDFSGVLPYTTNWWGQPGTGGAKEGQFANVFGLIPGFSYGDPHTYWSEWTPDRMSFGIDEVLVFSCPNRFVLANPQDPKDPNRVFMMVQIALGGAGGDVAKGTYPLAPSTYTPGHPAMLVEHLAHYALADE